MAKRQTLAKFSRRWRSISLDVCVEKYCNMFCETVDVISRKFVNAVNRVQGG